MITEKQLDSFLEGFQSVINSDHLNIFTPDEFEMILNGVPFIDLQDWKKNTNYKGSFYSSHKVVEWFWKTLETMNQNELAKFLQFSTGSSKTPVEGFRALESNRGEISPFCLNSVVYDERKPFIVAHTCFNRLDVPMYPTFEKMNECIHEIIKMDFEGFFGVKD
jgi:HECT-domain (ubiquitin-transferase)